MLDAKISVAVIKRLPKYYRYLELIGDKGIIRVSSQELSKITGLTASQIRQDLNHFGAFGQQGYGYNVEELKIELEKIMGVDKPYNVVIIGFGNIGSALLNYSGFKKKGFKVVGIFDNSPEIIGNKANDVVIKDVSELEEVVTREKVDIAILAIPAIPAQEITDKLVACGIKGIWNFAPIDLKLPRNVVLENVHLDGSLLTLTYYMNSLKDYPGVR
ncbi:redox-sensing transcriptional repressor Rex [Parvimonas micra]|jgi:AT-rich DNA-binding protein|uniref:Redox-sensing transcriptional repressor Rex n=2 Tax=Parvimonas micra TaxID=33033 RepID=A0A0B4S1M2_9FIRM|nr:MULTISPECIES: redox-sensing transcriptional repressor Rex [Parvimonas]AIZ36680.1 REX family transcriptional regulator [Parvimonas micra]AXU10555.1 redox-sensing transcriptional repressor Rex [Parvimonas micra]EDP23469.1 CoA binding domain protein [Parvimonas micra ATCC 33270]MBF1307607.1 redox-sensing transcriptional repressor Rex [Parvimonas micra]MCK6130067.1 redox-sensing transcriptional repressor Rex [Parvimonas micra]